MRNRFSKLSRCRGDKIAIERVAYELCEDQAAQGVAYFEARYSPIFLANPKGYTASAQDKTSLSYQDVVDCITSGLKRGELDFGVKSNQILCLITNQTGNDLLVSLNT